MALNKYATWYHNWESTGDEISVQIPNFEQVFRCNSNCDYLNPDDFAPTLDTFTQTILNNASLSPATTPIGELFDQVSYWHEIKAVAQGFAAWTLSNGVNAFDCAASCRDWWSVLNWNCYKQSQFCYWSANTLDSNFYKWYNLNYIAIEFELDTLLLYEQAVIAADDQFMFQQETIQIDIMKAQLQEALANAGGVLSDMEYKARMNKTKSVFLPVMAVLLIVVIAFLLINNKKQ